MKNILFCCLLSLFAATAASAQEDPAPAPVFKGIFDKDVTLNAGALLLLETTEKIQSGEVTVGKTVQFKVRTNVIAQSCVAIRAGAMAIGRVKAITPYSHNNPEEIRIELMYVQAVDGQMVPLNGNEQTIRGQFPGQDTDIETGTAITAHVMNTIEIKVE